MTVTLSLFHPAALACGALLWREITGAVLSILISGRIERCFVACHVCDRRRAGAACPSTADHYGTFAEPATPERSSLAVNGTVTLEVNQPLCLLCR